MNLSLSIFTIEIDASPMAVFEAKWHAEADQIGREWVEAHWSELVTRGESGIEFPPIYKLRLARPSERDAYKASASGAEYLGEVALVRFGDAKQHQSAKADTEHPTEIASEDQSPDPTSSRSKQQAQART